VSVFDFVTGVSIFSVAVPLTCCVVRFSALNQELRVLFLYILFSVFAEVVSVVLRSNRLSNIIIQNLYTVTECSLIIYMYFLRFHSKRSRSIIGFMYIGFVLLAIGVFVLCKGINKPDNLVSTYESCLFIVLSWGYFYKVMKEKNIEKLNQFYFAWINSAILIYFSMAFFSFLFNRFTGQLEMSLYKLVYAPHLITNISYNILLGVGVWKIK